MSDGALIIGFFALPSFLISLLVMSIPNKKMDMENATPGRVGKT